MVTHQDKASPSSTQSGRAYLKAYTRDSPKEIYEEHAKQKELRFQNNPMKDEEVKDASFQFDIISQLANIKPRVTLYELLRLSKVIQKVLREALADSEYFMAQIVEPSNEERDSYPTIIRS